MAEPVIQSNMDINQVREVLPHRYPFLMIDKVVEVKYAEDVESMVGRKITCIKNVTVNEPFFNGHFPHRPIMPGVLQIEAMAQSCALICYNPSFKGRDVLIVGVNDARFRRQVIPGDVLTIESEVIKFRKNVAVVKCRTLVEGKVASEATVMAALGN